MLRTRLVLFSLGLAAATLAAGATGEAYTRPDRDRVQGTWEVLSVHRDGVADPAQVGALVTFAGDQVTFTPRVVQIFDGTS
jgi:hypothetical protein